ncbi:hypothetical protein HETIRDRAFT_451127 [Heterobasidion irregulare TC 32-1]|uniref:Uncharacterized protein n=1 Tax=Heterobasidion irregulare (strain TC 32-1) TaxID=747525 RepID=W4K8C5_HETIT|nr:uncharacterized protein HETIRDRAFT_451127 [Heterobasidion irregulare TC 32-1]ETW81296.1 hypothetical protein HETIRDRAFT_451127 [Heterobasidion irregulare TC 32-1]
MVSAGTDSRTRPSTRDRACKPETFRQAIVHILFFLRDDRSQNQHFEPFITLTLLKTDTTPARPLARPPERRFRPRARTPGLTHSARTPPPSPGTQIRMRASPPYARTHVSSTPRKIPSFSIPRLAPLVTVPTPSPNLQPPASAALALRARAQSVANITARREEAEEPLTAKSELGRRKEAERYRGPYFPLSPFPSAPCPPPSALDPLEFLSSVRS